MKQSVEARDDSLEVSKDQRSGGSMAYQRTAPGGDFATQGDHQRDTTQILASKKRWIPIALIAIGTVFIGLALLSRLGSRAETPPPPPTEYQHR